MALQKFLQSQPTGCESAIDGEFGVRTASSFQRHLKAVGYYGFGYGLIDGAFGKSSILAAQRWMGEMYGFDAAGGIDGQCILTATRILVFPCLLFTSLVCVVLSEIQCSSPCEERGARHDSRVPVDAQRHRSGHRTTCTPNASRRRPRPPNTCGAPDFLAQAADWVRVGRGRRVQRRHYTLVTAAPLRRRLLRRAD